MLTTATAANGVDWLTAAQHMPWPVQSPFRMRPNLEKLDPDHPALLLHDEHAAVYQRERATVLATGAARALAGTPDPRVLACIGELAGAASATIDSRQIALALQEDFVILKQEGDSLRTEYLSVCFPSRWDPREKLGLDFAAIHAPVADNQMLQAAGPNLMAMAFMKQPMLRHVWLIVPSARLDQHPANNEAWWQDALADPAPLLPRLYFRIERQTTWPLPQLERAVFFIRLLMCRLVDVLAVAPERAAALAAALRSMTPAVVAYRGMSDALPRLLSELDAQS